MADPTAIALIPARSGSKRLTGKNVRPLAGHPLIAYTIRSALESGVFASVVVSTEDEEYAAIARHYGAEVPFLRPTEYAGDHSPDIEWLTDTLTRLRDAGRSYDAFGLLRPTSPFRRADTIRRAWSGFRGQREVDSLRAVERVTKHPGKMWTVRGERMSPLMPFEREGTPWHSCQSQSLPPVYVQNASLEIAWSRVVFDQRSISGHVVMPFLTEGNEGFDVNTPLDWKLAELLLSEGQASLPAVDVPAYAAAS